MLCLWLATACAPRSREPDTLTLLALAEPEHLDPRFPEDALGAALGRLVYRGLLRSDPQTFLPRLDLAESMTWRDATHLRVTLRTDARFQDGSPVEAGDVEATFRSLLDPARASRLRATYARVLVDVRAVDTRNIEFSLVRPDGTVESLLQQPILPARDARGPELRAVAGTESRFLGAGPLRVRSLQRAAWEFSHVGAAQGTPRVLRVLALHDPNTLAQRLLHGDGDVAELKPELYEVFDRHPDFHVASARTAGFTYVGIQCANPWLSDPRVRAAIAHAIDRERLRVGKFGPHAVSATGPLPPSHWAYEPSVAAHAYDPVRARALLDEAGLVDPPGPTPRVRWTMRVSSQRFAITVAHAIAAMLSQVGVEVEVRPSELATLFADLRGGRFDLTFLTVPDLSDPWGLSFWFGSASIPSAANPNAGGNRWRFRDAALDAALEAGARVVGPDARRPHYQHAQQILARELPVIPLWHADVVFAASRRFERLTPRGDGQLDFLLGLTRRGL